MTVTKVLSSFPSLQMFQDVDPIDVVPIYVPFFIFHSEVTTLFCCKSTFFIRSFSRVFLFRNTYKFFFSILLYLCLLQNYH